MNSKVLKTVVTLGLAALTAANLPAPAHAQTYTAQTIASGLFNPHGLAFDGNGALYIAEAGVGGTGPSITDGAGATVSYGETSGVTRWQNGVQTRLFSSLPSLAGQANGTAGASATGLHDIVFAANGTAYGIMGFGADPALRTVLTNAGAAKASQFGSLVQFNFNGTPSAVSVADVSAYERSNNPDGLDYNSNPYGLTALRSGGFAVADAGGNFVALLDSAGRITGSVLLPSYANPAFPGKGGPTYQSVPTAVTEAANGTLFVSELSGFPYVVGGAHIDVIQNGAVTNRFGGFTNLIDLTYSDGQLYALQLTTNGLAGANGPGPGQLLQIDPLTGVSQVLYTGLSFPGGLVVGPDHAFYVTNSLTSPGGGSVLRIAAVPEPGACALLLSVSAGGLLVLRRRTQGARKLAP